MSEFPKVMIFSNNCFSDTGSNGRTLANFFLNWPIENIAQFYIKNEKPNIKVCNNYFRITDSEAIKLFFTGKKKNIEHPQFNGQKKIENNLKRPMKRTPLNILLRDFIWRSMRWKGKEFDNWIKDFNPDVILLQAGDSPFMLNLATNIAKKNKIPLVIYNSESYYFKKENYMENSVSSLLFYPIFRIYLKKQYRRTMRYATHTIYISDYLQEAYQKEFNHKSTTLMTVTDYQAKPRLVNRDIPIFSYLGNLGLGRIDSLIKIANTLQDINKDIFLHVYGNTVNEDDRKVLEECKGLRYHGSISYEDVLDVMHDSDVLLHVENFSDFYKKDLQYGFSTKIADSLASERCFFVFAPQEIGFCDYLKKNEAAWVINSEDQLKESLKIIISNVDERNKYINNAKILSQKNHNKEKNGKKFYEIMMKEVRLYEDITN